MKTKVFLESGETYSKKTGDILPSITYGRYEIQKASPEAVQRINAARHNYKLRKQLSKVFDDQKEFSKLSVSQMERIVEVLNEEAR